MRQYTVQELINMLSKVEDKTKVVFIEGLSSYGNFYNVSGYGFTVNEEDEVIIQIDEYTW